MKRTVIAIAIVVVSASCSSTSPPDLISVTGSVIAIVPNSIVPNEGVIEISIAGADPIVFLVRPGVSIEVRKPGGLADQGSLASFAIGDSVVAWYPRDGIILQSLPAGYPVVKAEILRQ
jgi:hypothetical protein